MIIFLSDVVTLPEKEMKKTVKKQHYKFTFYQLETYYFQECKSYKYWLMDDEPYYEEKTWVNQSNYKEVFSIKFTDEQKLKAFLRKRYQNHDSCSFNTNLGIAIKNCNAHEATRSIVIVSTTTDQNILHFKLRNKKKTNKYPKKRRFHHYDDLDTFKDKEIKLKKIEKSLEKINKLY